MRSVQSVVAVAGNAAVDMTLREINPAWFSREGRDTYTPEMIHHLDAPPVMALGGNAAGAAYVLGKLGHRVRLNSPVGFDAAGDLVRSWLQDAKVECIAPPCGSTVVGITATDAAGKRLGTLQHTGTPVNWKLSAEPNGAAWLFVAIHSQVAPRELDEVCFTLQTFKGKGRTTVLDSGIGWLRTAKRREMLDLWSHVDLLIGTFDELAFWAEYDSPASVARFALERGPRQVIVKMGANGAAFEERGGRYLHQPACEVKRADLSIGAGDAFDGAVIAALVSGKALPAAVKFAQKTAAKVVETGRGVLGWGESRKG